MEAKHVYQSKPLDSSGRAHYTDEEKNTWSFFFHRQNELIKPRASKEFIRGVDLLNFSNEVPQHQDISAILNTHTGRGNVLFASRPMMKMASVKKTMHLLER